MGMRPSPCHEKLGLFQSTEQPKHGKLKPDWSSRLWGSWELEMQHIIDPLYCAHPCLVSGAGRGGENSSQNLLRVACHSVSGSRRSSNRDQPLSATDSLRGPGHVTSPDLYKIDLPHPLPSNRIPALVGEGGLRGALRCRGAAAVPRGRCCAPPSLQPERSGPAGRALYPGRGCPVGSPQAPGIGGRDSGPGGGGNPPAQGGEGGAVGGRRENGGRGGGAAG